MNSDMKAKLRRLLISHEGYRLLPYRDSKEHLTIGIGRNLDTRGVLPTEIDLMYQHDSDHFYNFLYHKFDWFSQLNEPRQIALVDMCFMGTETFMQFERMISALSRNDYRAAAEEILNSEYAKQVGERAKDLAKIIDSGELCV